jgi:uncharacterized protein (TIGR02996 family)
MTELDRFLAAITADPENAVAKWAFADWLDENPEAAPRAAKWASLFRSWKPEGVLIVGMKIYPKNKPLIDAIVTGCKQAMVLNCTFRDCDTFCIPPGAIVVGCEFFRGKGYATSS